MATKSTTTTTTTTPSTPSTPSTPKVPKVANQTITLLVTVNPKRGKSQARYELYKTCTTTHAFIAAGGYSADLAWDAQRKFISLAPITA